MDKELFDELYNAVISSENRGGWQQEGEPDEESFLSWLERELDAGKDIPLPKGWHYDPDMLGLYKHILPEGTGDAPVNCGIPLPADCGDFSGWEEDWEE